ncbi:MAG TPA: tetratricopeptide repeat protein [Kofleriaceae bacterium]|nr:tetratricopeptide repeat protein [Kofleriaceae bacterium]
MRCALLALLVGCSAPATLPELVQAEKLADHGDTDGAVTAYREAQRKCKSLKPARRATQACGEALLGEANALADGGRTDAAIAAYVAIPNRAPDDPVTQSTAMYRAGELLLKQGKTVEAWTVLWKTVTDWPDEALAGDALKTLVADGRTRNAQALADEIGKLITPLAETGVADNLVWWLADLSEHELANVAAARSLYDRIPADWPKSGFRDDARWHAARLSLALKDPQGAVDRLRALLATREVALGAGSYFSIWLDDAQLKLGLVLRDELHDYAAAAAALRKLPKDYPASILRDDALYELTVTLAKAADKPGACRAIADLRKQSPDSKYTDEASALSAELSCP